MMRTVTVATLTLFLLTACATESVVPQADAVKHGYVDNNGVKIHYAEAGEGPLVVMIHGFPDFWYTWRHQMAGLQDNYRVVAIDQRGYNKSDQPSGVENYDMRLLVSDVVSVVKHFGVEKATIVGHDWGGMVAWSTAFYAPEVVDQLVVLNLPHPNGMAQALRNNPDARAGTTYAKGFIDGTPNDPAIFFGYPMTAQTLAGWVTDEAAKPRYVEAFERSDFTAMLNYYKRNYPDVWSDEASGWPTAPDVSVPTLIFHGLADTALHSDGLNNTWDWVNSDMTLVTVPGASHFVQQDAAPLVTSTLRYWLDARR
ncbi:MAG: alpha/beta fold hydrolase [Gammaproteobacteria bacterium]